ncbi:MAG: DUF2141 domain-containing protein [Bacteroidales bacterium]|jgi:uncharacterized protein (DUF2141 family)|nr:DUF2141 domain-containing protein [Bacteroidales bacterium]
MKKITLTLVITLFALSSLAQKNIDINITGIDEIKGQIVVLVFDNPDNFPKDQKLAKFFNFPVTSKEMTVCVKDLQVQNYAIFIYHDKDNNGKCNQNFIGMPTEKIGFSNNIRPKLKAPKFNEAKVDTETNEISVELYKM